MAPRPDPDLIDLIPDEPPPYAGGGASRGARMVSIGLGILLAASIGIAIDHLFFGKPAGQASTEASIPDIKPDAAPIKSAPANPGGMQVPNQNQIVYQNIGPGAAKAQPPAQLAPGPEQPQTPPAPPPGLTPPPAPDPFAVAAAANPATTTPPPDIPAGPATSQSQAIAQAFAPAPAATSNLVMPPPAPAQGSPPQNIQTPAIPAPLAPAATPPAPATPAVPPPARVASAAPPAAAPSSPAFPPQPLSLLPEPPAAPLPKPPPPRPAAAAPVPAPAPVKAPPEKPEQAKPAPAKVASAAPLRLDAEPAAPPEKAVIPPPAPAPEKAAAPKAGGDYVIQLAAVGTEAAARTEWTRLQSANHDLLGGLSDDVAKADLGSKGVFYRLRAGPLDENTARQLCTALTKRKLSCIIAHR